MSLSVTGDFGEGYPGVDLGPEGSLAPPTDQEAVFQGANQFLGERRYPAHNQRMLELLEKYGLSTPGLETAIALHDVVDHGLIDPEADEAKQAETQGFIGRLYSETGNKDEFIYGLGCAISAGYWESRIGEGWRPYGPEAFAGKTIGERQQITAAIERSDSIPIDEAVLKSAKPDEIDIDTTALRHAMQDRDVEGLIIKAIELLDNVDNPPPGNPASTWRDCVEIIKCYSPALDLFGFKELASDLRGKALEYFYEDPAAVEKAKNQYELSEQYFDFTNDEIENVVSEILRIKGENIGIPDLAENKVTQRLSRVKSEGSLREKFSRPKYASSDKVSDGIGHTIILPNHELIDADLIIEIGEDIKSLFTEVAMQEGSDENSYIAEHPVDKSPVDERITRPKPSGYSAYTISLQRIIIEDGKEIAVPIEIQIVTAAQERLHTYGNASHIMYKADTAVTDPVREDLRQIESRGEHLAQKPNNQELNPHTWFDIVNLLPGLDTPIHQAYKLIPKKNSRFMVPHELEEFANSVLDDSETGRDILLPPSELDHDDFMRLIGLIDPSLKDDVQIQNAIELLMKQNLPQRRGGGGQMEGHLLPVAFHAGVMAALSSKHWDVKNSAHFLSDTITAALLHDAVEDIDKSQREEMKETIRFRFGDRVADIVDSLTSPAHIKDSHERRTAYSQQLENDSAALMIKLSDRMQNHIVDLTKLATSNPDAEEMEKIRAYISKTMRYLGSLFKSKDFPDEYRQTYKAVMDLAYWFR